MSLAGNELWPVQKDGDICMHIHSMPANSHAHHRSQRAKPATKREMTQFHSDEYVDFLNKITPNNMNQFVKEQHKCVALFSKACQTRRIDRILRTDNVGDHCPVFDGLFEYCSISAGGSMG